jgi:nucleoside-diphosphate-sugar epimerase
VGQTPYAIGKLLEEKLINEQMKSAGLNFYILRLGTLCGFSIGMRFHTAINRFCWQAINGEALTLYDGATEIVRPYLTLLDASFLAAQILAGKHEDKSVFNAVTISLPLKTLLDVFEQECKTLAIPVQTKLIDSPSPHMSDVYIPPSESLVNQLEPLSRLKLAIRETLDRLIRV